ncbi:MAG: DNA-processing protein DprA [Sphingomonadaceae bacterium]
MNDLSLDRKGQAELTQEEAFARIRLLRTPNVGPVSYRQLLYRYGDAVTALEALPDMAFRGGRIPKPVSREQVEREIAAVRRAKARYLFHDSQGYPVLLAQQDSAPPILTWRGDITLAARPCIAIVGARNASAAAITLAGRFAAGLRELGFVIVSGLARGIDGAAHLAALPETIGVIASGIDISYPPQHADLQEKIAQEGLLLAEQPPGTEPRGRHFPGRNRIIAGIAGGTLVVEAAPKSGSLITARLAAEAGREVMAIPGNPLDARAQGCNLLIRDGAVLVQSVEDVAELLHDFSGQPRSTFREPVEDLYTCGIDMEETPADIAGLLSNAPVEIDALIRQTGENPGAVHLALLEMELSGLLERHAGGRVSLRL